MAAESAEPGRPLTTAEIEQLVVQMAQENRGLGIPADSGRVIQSGTQTCSQHDCRYFGKARHGTAIKTLPFGSKVAVCPNRDALIGPVAVNVPADCAGTFELWPANKSNARTTPVFTPRPFNFRLQTRHIK